MKMMKTFKWPDDDVSASEAWQAYNDGDGNRGFIRVYVDEDLSGGYPDYEVHEEGPWPYKPLYDWLVANGAEHGETVLVEYDW